MSDQCFGALFVDALFGKSGHIRRFRHGQAVQNCLDHLAFRKIGIEILLRFAAMTAEAALAVELRRVERFALSSPHYDSAAGYN